MVGAAHRICVAAAALAGVLAAVAAPPAAAGTPAAGDTGICFDKPTGSVCLWEVRVEFRRGNVTGEVGTVATKGYSINSIPHTTRLARAALARWH